MSSRKLFPTTSSPRSIFGVNFLLNSWIIYMTQIPSSLLLDYWIIYMTQIPSSLLLDYWVIYMTQIPPFLFITDRPLLLIHIDSRKWWKSFLPLISWIVTTTTVLMKRTAVVYETVDKKVSYSRKSYLPTRCEFDCIMKQNAPHFRHWAT